MAGDIGISIRGAAGTVIDSGVLNGADGNDGGGATQFATLSAGLALTHGNFTIT